MKQYKKILKSYLNDNLVEVSTEHIPVLLQALKIESAYLAVVSREKWKIPFTTAEWCDHLVTDAKNDLVKDPKIFKNTQIIK